ncbi:MAG: glycosyltransferase family 2 protein [Burkholderiaceae bacterium]
MSNIPSDPADVTVPAISVIIPTRNRVDLLTRALRAVANQSFRAFEVIVVDDGSDATTQAAYTKLWSTLDSRFYLMATSGSGVRSVGPSVSRNLGIGRARGEIIAFCDDDDFWTAEDHLEAVAFSFSSTPGLDMYIANQTGVSSKGVVIADWMPQLGTTGTVKHAQVARAVTIRELCTARSFAHLNILVVRKAIVEQVGGFWERVSYEEDRDFFWRVADQCSAILYNPRVIGQHNIPDERRADNQSTRHSLVERWLLASLVCQHISTSVRNDAIASLARQYDGDILRRLSIHLDKQNESKRALDYAKRALAARFSLKWSLYLAVLCCKALFPKK